MSRQVAEGLTLKMVQKLELAKQPPWINLD